MSRLSKNIAYNLIGQTLVGIISLFSIKYTLRNLGNDVFGIIMLVGVFNAVIVAVMEMGISRTAVREIAGCIKTEPDYIRDLIRTSTTFYWGTFLLLVPVIYFLAPVIVRQWIHLETLDTATAIFILRMLGIPSLVLLPNMLYSSLFTGIQRMEYNNIIEFAAAAGQSLGVIVIIQLGGGVFPVVYWLASLYIVKVVVYCALAMRFFNRKAFLPGYSKKAVARNARFSIKLMWVTVLSLISDNVDKAILSKLFPVVILGYYGTSFGYVSKALFVTRAIVQAAYPSLSELYKAGDMKGFVRQYHKLQDFTCFAVTPIMAAIPFALLPLFEIFLSKSAAQLLLIPTALLAAATYLATLYNLPFFVNLAGGKPEIAAKLNLYELFVSPPSTVALILLGKMYGGNHGALIGAGLSKIVYWLFALIYTVPKTCREFLGISAAKWFLHAGRYVGLTVAVYVPAWYLAETAAGGRSIFSLAAAYLCGTAIFLAVSYLLMAADSREAVRSSFKRLVNKVIAR